MTKKRDGYDVLWWLVNGFNKAWESITHAVAQEIRANHPSLAQSRTNIEDAVVIEVNSQSSMITESRIRLIVINKNPHHADDEDMIYLKTVQIMKQINSGKPVTLKDIKI